MLFVAILYIGFAFLLCLFFSLPTLLVCIKTKKYFDGKGSFKSIFLLNFTILLFNILIIWYFIKCDKINFFDEFFNAWGAYDQDLSNCKLFLSIFLLIILDFKPLINFVTLYKDNKNEIRYKNICKYSMGFLVVTVLICSVYLLERKIEIRSNRIKITDENVYSYYDFEKQLEERGLKNKRFNYLTPSQILALDSNNEYWYEFTSGYTNWYRLSYNTDKKFPFFVYDSYKSLIKKGNDTQLYYDSDEYIYEESLDDECVDWYIYYVDGQLYAATGNTSKYDGILVSEEEDIIVYNSKRNYYVRGGGIIDTNSGMQRYSFPYISEEYNNRCLRKRIVDRIDVNTLDIIAKELSLH